MPAPDERVSTGNRMGEFSCSPVAAGVIL